MKISSNILAVCVGVITSLSIISCKTAENDEESKTVYLRGSIVDYDQDTLYLSNLTTDFMLLKEEIYKIPLNEDRSFDYAFDLEAPAYFQTGRQFMYLTPGDSLKITIDTKSRSNAEIEGKGAEANLYLRNLPYPKGGSFFDDARQKKISVESEKEMELTFKPILEERMADLTGLKNVSTTFMELEKARLQFEYINTLQSATYLYINDMFSKKITQEEFNAKIKTANAYLQPKISEALRGVDYNNVDFLQFEAFQGLLYRLKDTAFTSKENLPALNDQLQDYMLAKKIKSEFGKQGYTKAFTDYYDTEIVKVKDPMYKASLEKILQQYEPIKSGAPASDLTFVDLSGQQVKLSDYKGKVVVIDLWATWCGPCMAEKPAYEALVEKYADNENIALLSLSIDTKNVWQNYFSKETPVGAQLQINRSELSAYQVVSIPRVFVIDKEQKIVDVFAPVPSSGALEEMFAKYL